MALQRTKKTVTGLKEVDAMLDSLVDPKFRKAALRNAGRRTMNPVKERLQANIPVGSSDTSSYKHYQGSTKKEGYTSGDLRNGVKVKLTVNTDKKIKTGKNGYAKKGMESELIATVTFDNHVYKLASILENGRTKRIATTRNGKVFHFMGRPTNAVKRDIGVITPRNFVSQTFAECESMMTSTFRMEIVGSIQKQIKLMEKKKGGK